MTRDEKERAADYVGGPDEPILFHRAESLDERVNEIDREDERAGEEDRG